MAPERKEEKEQTKFGRFAETMFAWFFVLSLFSGCFVAIAFAITIIVTGTCSLFEILRDLIARIF